MAKSGIADVWMGILPSLDGLTKNLKKEFKVFGEFATDTLARSIVEGGKIGSQALGNAFSTLAQTTQSDFSSILNGVDVPVSQLNNQFGNVANQAGQAMQQQMTTGVTNAMDASANQAQNSFQSVLGGLSFSTSNLNSSFSSLAGSSGSALTGAIVGSMSAGVAGGAPVISGTTATAVSSGIQNGMNHGITGSAPVISTGIAGATNSGAVSGFKAAGPAILAAVASLGIGAMISGSITSALEKETGQAKMTASLGLDPAAAKKAGEVAGNLYMNAYGDSMEDVQNSTSAVLSSFADLKKGSTKDIEEVTKRALNMASVFEVDVARSTQVASQMITTGWAKDATGAMDMLSASMQKVPANVREDIMDAVDEYGPFMSELGLEGAKGMELLVKSSDRGSFGIDKLGDALKEFTIRSKDMSEASGAGYASLGLDQASYSKALLSGGKTGEQAFGKIIDGLMKIKDPVEKQTAALALFGTPLEDLSVNEIPKFLKSMQTTGQGMGDVAKAAKDMDKVLGETSASTLTSFKRTLESTFADALMPIVKEMQPLLAGVATWFRENKEEVSGWVRAIFDGIKYAIIPIIEVFKPMLDSMGGWFKKNKGDVADWVNGFIDGIHKWLIPGLEITVGLLSGLFGWLTSNQEMLNKWVPVLLEIAASLIGVWAVWNVVQGFIALVVAIKAVAVGFWAAATASTVFNVSILRAVLLTSAVIALGLALGWVIHKGVEMAGGWGAIGQFWGDMLTGMGESISGFMGGVIQWFMDIPSHLSVVFGWIGRTWNDMWGNLGRNFMGFSQIFIDGWNRMVEWISGITNWSNEQIAGINTAISGLVTWVGQAWDGMMNRMITAIQNFANFFVDQFNGMFEEINGLKFPDWVPEVGGENIGFNIPFLPQLATGGDIMGPTALIAGEKDPETIVNRGKMNDLIDNINANWETRNGTPGATAGATYINVQVETSGDEDADTLGWKIAQAIDYNRKR